MVVKSRAVLREQFLGTDPEDHNRDLVDSVAVGAAADAITDAATDAETEHALNSTFDDTEVEAALDDLGTAVNAHAATLNAILVALRAYGIVSESEG